MLTLSGVILLACASPGPDFVAVTSHALNNRRSGAVVGLGIASAVVVWATLAILGFGLLIKELFWLYEAIRSSRSARVRAIHAGVRRPIDALMGAALVGLGVRLATSR